MIGWIDLGIGIAMLLIKYGPTLVRLARDVYDQIEEYSKRKQQDASFVAFDGKKAESEDKRMRYDTLLKTGAKLAMDRILTQDEIDELRESTWKRKNRKKPGKAK